MTENECPERHCIFTVDASRTQPISEKLVSDHISVAVGGSAPDLEIRADRSPRGRSAHTSLFSRSVADAAGPDSCWVGPTCAVCCCCCCCLHPSDRRHQVGLTVAFTAYRAYKCVGSYIWRYRDPLCFHFAQYKTQIGTKGELNLQKILIWRLKSGIIISERVADFCNVFADSIPRVSHYQDCRFKWLSQLDQLHNTLQKYNLTVTA